jgi:hypothetical protein
MRPRCAGARALVDDFDASRRMTSVTLRASIAFAVVTFRDATARGRSSTTSTRRAA